MFREWCVFMNVVFGCLVYRDFFFLNFIIEYVKVLVDFFIVGCGCLIYNMNF